MRIICCGFSICFDYDIVRQKIHVKSVQLIMSNCRSRERKEGMMNKSNEMGRRDKRMKCIRVELFCPTRVRKEMADFDVDDCDEVGEGRVHVGRPHGLTSRELRGSQ